MICCNKYYVPAYIYFYHVVFMYIPKCVFGSLSFFLVVAWLLLAEAICRSFSFAISNIMAIVAAINQINKWLEKGQLKIIPDPIFGEQI